MNRADLDFLVSIECNFILRGMQKYILEICQDYHGGPGVSVTGARTQGRPSVLQYSRVRAAKVQTYG